MFSAPDVSDRRKGGALLNAALERLNGLPFRLLVAGANETPPFPRSFWSLTHLVDEAEIALSYAAADVFVLPTLAENLPNAALESVASGTPCVSFDVGGVPDVVRHMETGYLAKLGDADALAEGIRTLLADEQLRDRMGEACRALAEARVRRRARGEALRRPVRRRRRLMCGIAGVVGAWDDALLERLGASLRHRGPDGGGVVTEGDVALVARRLAILDLETGEQPMTSPSGRSTIVFNGEIYNAPELRARLERDGRVFATDHSDTEVVLALVGGARRRRASAS